MTIDRCFTISVDIARKVIGSTNRICRGATKSDAQTSDFIEFLEDGAQRWAQSS